MSLVVKRSKLTERLISIASVLAGIAAFCFTAGDFYPNPLLYIFGRGAGDRIGDGTILGFIIAAVKFIPEEMNSVFGTVVALYFGYHCCSSFVNILLDHLSPIPRDEWNEQVGES